MRSKTKPRKKDRTSPYKLKTPMVYSGEYRAWRAAIKSQDAGRIEETNAAHRKRFVYNPNLKQEIENASHEQLAS